MTLPERRARSRGSDRVVASGDTWGVAQPRGNATGVLGARTRFHVLFRLAVRAASLRALAERSPLRPRDWRRFALSCALDAAETVWLHRDDDLHLLPRVVLGTADVAAWSDATSHPYDLAVLGTVPLLAEAGARMGFVAYGIGAVQASAVIARRRWRGDETDPTPWIWALLAATSGVALRYYERRQDRAAELRWEAELEARTRVAYDAGRSAVALGADTAVDRLWSTGPIIGAEALGVTSLRQWRAQLAAQVGHDSIYLRSALLAWEHRTNRNHELANDVEIDIDTDDGLVIISPSQQAELGSRLDALGLLGPVRVEVARRSGTEVPGSAKHLRVNGLAMLLHADALAEIAPIDPGPVVAVLGAMWLALDGLDRYGGAPRSVIVPSLLATAALGSAMARFVGPDDRRGHFASILAAFGITAGFSATANPRLRRPLGPLGEQRYPVLDAGAMPAVLSSIYFAELTRRQRVGVLGAAAVTLAAGLATLQGPPQWRQLLIEPLWLVAAIVPATLLAPSYAERAAVLDAERIAASDRRIENAFLAGRRSVIDLVDTMRRSADAQLERLAASGRALAEELAAVRRRLGEVEQLLAALQHDSDGEGEA